MLKICIVGVSGRMGREIMQAIAADKASFVLSGAVDHPDSESIGKNALALAGQPGTMIISADVLSAAEGCDVIIDFSGAPGTLANLDKYRAAKKPLVVGSTGFNDTQMAELKALSNDIPLLWASNMSVGVNVVAKLVELAAAALGEGFDIEVFEAHHRNKADAPSGTALTLAEAAARGRGVNLKENAVFCREGMTGARKAGTIGFQVLRGGDIAGDHTVYFCADGERVEITHRASSRQTFAKGALRAAAWLAEKPAGLYNIKDVLGL